MALENNNKGISNETQMGIRTLCKNYLREYTNMQAVLNGMDRDDFQNPIPFFQEVTVSLARDLYSEDGAPKSTLSFELFRLKNNLLPQEVKALDVLRTFYISTNGELNEVAYHRSEMWGNVLTYLNLYMEKKNPDRLKPAPATLTRAKIFQKTLDVHLAELRTEQETEGVLSTWSIPLNVRLATYVEAVNLHELVKYFCQTGRCKGSKVSYLGSLAEEFSDYPNALADKHPRLTEKDIKIKREIVKQLSKVIVPAFILPDSYKPRQ